MENNIITFLKQKDYELIDDSLGRGSFGVTVLIRDPFIDELFVAKKYAPTKGVDKEAYYKNFIDEIKILHRLNHPNVVRIFNYYPYEEHHTGYIVMEYVNGDNIANYINKMSEGGDGHEIDDVFDQVIEAFCCIESNKIAHRDIRENNILVTNDGVVKIIDFGIGKNFNNDTKTKGMSYDSLAGDINRPNTLPQEYYEEKYTIKTDMFYVGELFSRLISSARQGKNSISFSYHKIVERMMRVNPDERFGSFSEIKEILSRGALDRLNVTRADKEIYRRFVDNYYSCIERFSESPEYNNRTVFISRLEKVLQENMFEDYVQDNKPLIECLVKKEYSYYPKGGMVMVEDLSNFIDWYKEHDDEAQEIILSNIISKMNTIKIFMDFDIPF